MPKIIVRLKGVFARLRAIPLRPHRSTLVFLVPVVIVLLLLNVPGWRVARLRLPQW